MERLLGLFLTTLCFIFSLPLLATPTKGTLTFVVYDNDDGTSKEEVWFQPTNTEQVYVIQNITIAELSQYYQPGTVIELDIEPVSQDAAKLNGLPAAQPQSKTDFKPWTGLRKMGYFAVNITVPGEAPRPYPVDWKNRLTTNARDAFEHLEISTYNKLLLPTDANGDGQPDVFGMFEYEAPALACERNKYARAVREQAAAQGIDFDFYDSRVMVIYGNNNCPGGGVAYVNCQRCNVFLKGLSKFTSVHEIGHNIAFLHAGIDADDNLQNEKVYGDKSSPMGTGQTGFNAPNMVFTGWVAPEQIIDTAISGTHIVNALYGNDCCSQTKVVRIPRANDTTGFSYMVSYRERGGPDAGLLDEYHQKLFVYSGKSTSLATTSLHAILSPGETFAAQDGSGMTIRYLAQGESSAVFEIVR